MLCPAADERTKPPDRVLTRLSLTLRRNPNRDKARHFGRARHLCVAVGRRFVRFFAAHSGFIAQRWNPVPICGVEQTLGSPAENHLMPDLIA